MSRILTIGSLAVVALVGSTCLQGCAPVAQSSAAAPQLAPDCSFRSASTCWTVAGRFPLRPPRPAAPKPDEIRGSSPITVASAADSTQGTR
jgi:hypothetical protein